MMPPRAAKRLSPRPGDEVWLDDEEGCIVPAGGPYTVTSLGEHGGFIVNGGKTVVWERRVVAIRTASNKGGNQ